MSQGLKRGIRPEKNVDQFRTQRSAGAKGTELIRKESPTGVHVKSIEKTGSVGKKTFVQDLNVGAILSNQNSGER